MVSMKDKVCAEILEIMQIYHEQEATEGVDTPGGLEHMGDVWRLFGKWEEMLSEERAVAPVEDKSWELARLLIEARDALPAISLTSAKLHGVKLDLADRIAAALKPWEVPADTPGAI